MGYEDAHFKSIPRDEIVEAAQSAIATTRAKGDIVPTSLVRRLMKVARTHDEFLLGGWRLGSCGCLIGNLYGPGMPLGAGGMCANVPDLEVSLGIDFDNALEGHRHWNRKTVLQVID